MEQKEEYNFKKIQLEKIKDKRNRLLEKALTAVENLEEFDNTVVKEFIGSLENVFGGLAMSDESESHISTYCRPRKHKSFVTEIDIGIVYHKEENI